MKRRSINLLLTVVWLFALLHAMLVVLAVVGLQVGLYGQAIVVATTMAFVWICTAIFNTFFRVWAPIGLFAVTGIAYSLYLSDFVDGPVNAP